MKRVFCLLTALLLLTGCSKPLPPDVPDSSHPFPQEKPGHGPSHMPSSTEPFMQILPQGQPNDPPQIHTTQLVREDLFSERDYEDTYDMDACRVSLDGSSARCQDSAVNISGNRITITKKGTYILSGVLDAGMVIVDADKKDKVQLVLENASIHSETSAAIYVCQADKVFLTLAEGTENTLSNGGSFVPVDDSNIDAVVFSRDDLTVNGTGKLQIHSPAGHGIVSKDEVTMTGGDITIDAAVHGITGQDCVSIDGAALTIRCGKDAIQAENDEDPQKGFVYLAESAVTVQAQDNGIRATGTLQIDSGMLELDSIGDGLHSDSDMIINGGSITLSTQDDGFHADNVLAIYDGTVQIVNSYEGLEAKSVLIAGGDISLVSQDDGINAAGGNDQSGFGGHRGGDRFHQGDDSCILISGGNLRVNAAGDGMDSNGGLYITGGYTVAEGPADNRNGPLDYSGTGVLTGGTLIVSGSAGMAQSLWGRGQGVLAVSTGSCKGGTAFEIQDSGGNVVLSGQPQKAYGCIVVSCPEFVSGEVYSLTVGDLSGEIKAQ